MQEGPSCFSADVLRSFGDGVHFRADEQLGAHPEPQGGTRFAVWAPNAVEVSVIGEFNGWERGRDLLSPVATSGIWAGFVPEANHGHRYKYFIRSRHCGYEVEKADPCGFFAERPPKTASRVWNLDDYDWSDGEWMERRGRTRQLDSPVSIYEVHLASWRRNPDEGNRPLTYLETAIELGVYVKEMGFTHVELMPVMEHPQDESWGYRVTGFFSATSRFGTPQDLMFLVDHLHRNGIGVILDWPLSHFALDPHGLAFFDGTHLYDHQNDLLGYHPEWHTRNFNYGRQEVRSFLGSVAFFWLDRYHIDGLRFDAVASMIYRDYGRQNGDWIRNPEGGKEDWDAVNFLKDLNAGIYREFPGVETFAEESTAWSKVTHHPSTGGMGFGFKWDMGWMNDTLMYMATDPIYRRYHHDKLTFRMLYVLHENFLMSLSHDEVTQGKHSLAKKMPHDDWEKFANLRLLYGAMYTHPGKKLLFMGCEWGQWEEWNYDTSLKWDQLQHDPHRGMSRWVRDLNQFYRSEPALYETDCGDGGFEWIDLADVENSVISFLRRDKSGSSVLVAVFNFTPVVREHYRVGVPQQGWWREVLNSDSSHYWGSNVGNGGGVHGRGTSRGMTGPAPSRLHFRPCRR